MSYINSVNLIRQVSEAVNPDGIFVHGRTWDASLEFNSNNIQIYLYPLQNTIDQNNSFYESWKCVLGFYFQDSPDSTNEEREQLISNADILSRSFLSTIQLVESVDIYEIRTEPKYRQMSGTYSGVIISFSLNLVTDLCSDGEIIIIPTVKTFCEKVDECLGISEVGNNDKFLNEKGKFIEIEIGGNVDSVNGKTGVVVLDKNDIGLGSVDNTSDADKPVSSATQTALNLKQDNIGYTAENSANKTNTVVGNEISITKYLSVKGVYDWVISLGYITASALTNYLQKNIPITGATKIKITYDSNGLVTAGADATTADIPDSSNKRYVTDTQLTVISNTSGINTGDNATNSQYSGLAASKEDTANKSTSTGDIASSVKFPVWSAVVSYVTGLGYLLSSTAASTYQAILTSINFGSFINSLTAKTTPVDADYLGIMDSADSNKQKKLSWANLKATLKAYFDGIYGNQYLVGMYSGQTSVTLITIGTKYLLQGIPIAANTFQNGDIFYFKARGGKFVSGSTSRSLFANLDTTLGTAGTQIATYASGSSGSQYLVPLERAFAVTSTGIYGLDPAISAITDMAAVSAITTQTAAIDFTQALYLNILASCPSANAPITIYEIEIWRYRP